MNEFCAYVTLPTLLSEESDVRLRYGIDKSCITDQVRILFPGEEDEEEEKEGGSEKEVKGKNVSGRNVSLIVIGVGVLIGIIVAGVVVLCRYLYHRKRTEQINKLEADLNAVPLLSYMDNERGENAWQRFESNNSTESTFTSSSSSLSRSEGSENSNEGREEEEEEEKEEEENGNGNDITNNPDSSPYPSAPNGVLQTIDGKTIPVGSDVQWPLSEGMVNQNVTPIRWRPLYGMGT